MDENLYINTARVENAGQELMDLINRISDEMDELHSTFTRLIPDEIKFDWAENLKEDWEEFKNADIPNALENLKESVGNLGLVRENVEKYSEEE